MANFTRIRDQVLTAFGDNWLEAQEYLIGPKQKK